jgi:hypothetical protein
MDRIAAQVVGFPANERKNLSGSHASRRSSVATAWSSRCNKQLGGVAGWKVTETDQRQA